MSMQIINLMKSHPASLHRTRIFSPTSISLFRRQLIIPMHLPNMLLHIILPLKLLVTNITLERFSLLSGVIFHVPFHVFDKGAADLAGLGYFVGVHVDGEAVDLVESLAAD